MLQQAIEKIQNEMNNGGPEIKTLGQYLLSEVLTSETNAASILPEEKTLTNFMKSLREEAKKKRTGDTAVMTAEEILPLLHKYYDIGGAAAGGQAKSTQPASLNTSLADLLGE